jgi:hypothetical protein
MNSRKSIFRVLVSLALVVLPSVREARAIELFIHRPGLGEKYLAKEKKLILRGELFFFRLAPSTFPSYNDQSGIEDKWNFGFQDVFAITRTTTVTAQLVTHDDGRQRTKFDWHFHLRQYVLPHLVFFIGHDSDHDSDHVSTLRGKPYFTNRNYIGVTLPWEGRHFFVEPFTHFFHNTNQRSHLDLSGETLKQEYGLRAGVWTDEGLSAHLQAFFQTDKVFSLGQAFFGELLLRMRAAKWLELTLGGSLWTDIGTSVSGAKKSYAKLIWGISFPF